MKTFYFSILLLPFVLAQVFAGPLLYSGKGFVRSRATQPKQPVYVVAVGNRRSHGDNSFYVAPHRAYEEPSDGSLEENEEKPSKEEDELSMAGYIPVTDENGSTYLLHESALENMHQPQQQQQQQQQLEQLQLQQQLQQQLQLQQELQLLQQQQQQFPYIPIGQEEDEDDEEEEQEIVVPNGSVQILGGEIYDEKTGENSLVLPGDALDGLVGDDDILALIESPNKFGKSRQVIIRRRRRPAYYSSYPNQGYSNYSKKPQRRPVYVSGPRRKVINFGKVKVVTMHGRRKIYFSMSPSF